MIKIFAQKGNWGGGIELLVGNFVGNNELHYLLPENSTFTKAEEGERILEPSFTLRMTEAQCLMDELWNCGLRPIEGTGSAGSLLATQNHLKDLQKYIDILFRKLGSTE